MPRSPLLVWQAMGDAPGDQALFFVQTWAEEVVRLSPIARALRERHDRDMHASELGEWWSPDDQTIAPVFRQLWSAQATLVWAAHQLQRWLVRYASDTGQAEPDRIPGLVDLRNALEHLDEALLDAGYARPGEGAGGDNRSLRNLPEQTIFIGSGGVVSGELFGIVDSVQLETIAREVLAAFEPPDIDGSDYWERDDR